MKPIKQRHYFLRYFAVFCVPVLMLGSLLFTNNILYTNRETGALRNTALQQMVEAMDTLVAQTQSVTDKASLNEDILSAHRGVERDYAAISQWLRLYEDLFIDEVTLAYYLLGDTAITTRDGAVAYHDFETKYADSLNFSLAGYFKTLNQSSRFTTLNLSRKSGAFYALSYTYPVIDSQARHIGTLCFLLPRSALQAVQNRYFPESSAQLHIYDAANKAVYQSAPEPTFSQPLSKMSGLGLIEDSAQGVVLRAVSQRGRFTYYMVMPRQIFYKASGTDMTFLYILWSALILFSTLAAVLLTRSHFQKLQTMHSKNLRLEDALDAQSDIIRSLVLRKLIDGSQKEQAVINYNLLCANIQFYHGHFFVLAADFATANEDSQSAAFALAFEDEKSSEIYYQVVTLPESRCNAVIINTALDRENLAQEVTALAAKWDIAAPMGLSACHDTSLGLHVAYVEALVALKEKLGPANEQLHLFSRAEDSGDSPLPVLENMIIQESIRNGNKAMLDSSIEGIFNKIVLLLPNPQMVQLACFDVINLCVRLYTIFEMPLPPQALQDLSAFDSPTALIDPIKALLFSLCDGVQENFNKAVASTKYNLIGFVQAHFRDSNLSLNLLADEFNLSQSYISKLFKDETGQNFISYVKDLRMSYVKKQLLFTDLQVKDIILDTGYVDVANFTRTFKQEVGVTPLQYRRNIRQNG